MPPLENRRFEVRAHSGRAELGNGESVILEPLDLSAVLDELKDQERNNKSRLGYY
jgi:hypothetical protein